MSAVDELYAELKPDIEALAEPLFEFSRLCLRERGNFLPHGAVLRDGGEVRLVGAAPDTDGDPVSSTEVLPALHEGLRLQGRDALVKAVGVAENVTIAREGEAPTRAIKVLCEHRRGLTVALYLPFRKNLLGRYAFGAIFSTPTTAEVGAWTV